MLDRLGPDPLRPDADPDVAWARISKSSRSVAELLMDQAVLAGVGNVYRSEVLFRHRLSPFTEGRTLRRSSWRLIWDDLERLMPLGVATGRIVTVEDQVLRDRGRAGPRRGAPPHRARVLRLQARRDAVPRVRLAGPDPPRRRPQPLLVRALPAPPLSRRAAHLLWVSRLPPLARQGA